MQALWALGPIVGTLGLVLALNFVLDKRAHEGVSWFVRRRVLRDGTAASAKVLSVEMTSNRSAPGRRVLAFSIVYEISSSLRLRGIETMPGYKKQIYNLVVGKVVQVRYDEARKLVVLVRKSDDEIRQDRSDADSARRQREERLLQGGGS